MKPMRLTISGLNSFREQQEIDFSQLTELGMFGIFGPTGSGKSSILDAITLALYGNVERAGRHTQGILNQAEKKLDIAFDFEIGLALDRKRYRVERVYKRGAGEYSVQHQSSRLLQLEHQGETDYGLVMIAENQREVNQAVLRIVGLQQDDFTRAVVLPQGKFAEFLQLTGKTRNEMMERLFGLEKFGQSLSNRANRRAKDTTAKRENIETAQRELGDASEAAVNEAERVLETRKSELEQADKNWRTAQNRLKDFEQIRDFMTQLDGMRTELNGLYDKTDEIEVIRQALQRHDEAVILWPKVQSWQEAEAAVELAQKAVEGARTAAQEAKQRLDKAVLERDAVEKQAAELEPELNKQKVLLHEAKTLETELGKSTADLDKAKQAYETVVRQNQAAVNMRDKARHEAAGLEAQMDGAQQQETLHRISPERRQRLSNLGTAEQVWISAVRRETDARDKLIVRQQQWDKAQAGVKKWSDEEQRLVAQEGSVQTEADRLEKSAPAFSIQVLQDFLQWRSQAETRLETLAKVAGEATEVRRQIAEAEQTCSDETERVGALTETRDNSKKELDKLQSEYETYMATNEFEWIRRLQARVRNGEPCPVCGATDHPDLSSHLNRDEATTKAGWSTEQANALRLTEAAYNQHSDELHKAEIALTQAASVLEFRRENLKQKEQELTDVLAGLSAYWTPDIERMMSCKVPATQQEWESFLKAFDASMSRLQKQNQEWEKEKQAVEERAANLKEQMQEARHQLSLAQTREKTAQGEAAVQQREVEAAADEKTKAVDTLFQVLRQLDVEPALESAPETADETLKRLIENTRTEAANHDKLAGEARETMQKLAPQLAQLRSTLREQEEAVGQTDREVTKLQSTIAALQQKVTAQTEQLRGYTGGLSVADAMTKVESQLQELKTTMERVQTLVKSAEDGYSTTSQSVTKAEAAVEEKTATLRNYERQLTDALSESNFATVDALRDARLDEGDVQERTNTVKTYDKTVEEYQTRSKDLETKLAGRSVDAEAMERVKQDAKTADTVYRRCLEAHGAAKESYSALLTRKARWQELEQQRLEVDGLARRLDVLTKVLRGNAFVRYVAKEQMELVARQASNRLAHLTHGRYALTFNDDGDFLMRDIHNGGQTRPVNTLSGGETFLTSLSLALALSSHIQLRGEHPLEFFFLDEGFGTLDPDLLDVVISSMESLNLERMSIGLISHVPELRQRMQRRLIVEPALPAGRGTVVRMEKA
ncbi:AAA family ATPase [Alicyclobacillus sp. SO9]|uniref:AAA family ATPase n=1 Tax=Alicyclobacillus sp. SO9 TaxID=2665646 RepID=UPI0018E6F8A9|nr:AAA family ATPase [Alicyclobacillus sp. SO9]QQE80574.1 AAA family ATPase [Alicyclobacillus sp. SO9]